MGPGRRQPPPMSSERARPPGGPAEPATEDGASFPGPMWAEILSHATGTNRYGWVQSNDGEPPTFGATYADGFAAGGDDGVDEIPAYEINGRTDVPIGARVKLWPAGDLTYYVFAWEGAPNWKAPVRAVATTNGTLATAFENGDSLDGVTLAIGDRILLTAQSTASQNGIYTVNATGAPTRAADADTGAELSGAVVVVLEGTLNSDTLWLCTTDSITIGVTSIAWACIKPKALDNHALRQNGTDGVQTSKVVLSDASDVTAYNADSPTSSTPYASIGFSVQGATGPVPVVALAPVGSASGSADVAYLVASESGGHLLSATLYVASNTWVQTVTIGDITLLSTSERAALFSQSVFARTFFAVDPDNLSTAGYTSYGQALGAAIGNGITVVAPGDTSTLLVLAGNSGSGPIPVTIRIRGAAAFVDGVTGTPGPGFSTTGGIVTGAGSGSFVGTGANTYTDTQTITSASAPALVAKQTVGDSSHTLEVKNAAGTVTFFVTGAADVTATSFTGSGAGLTGLNASQLTSGTVPLARLPSGLGVGGSLALFSTCY